MKLKFYLTVFILFLHGGPTRAQDDFLMPGEIAPPHVAVKSHNSSHGLTWRFQMGSHFHLVRDSYWDNDDYNYRYGRGTRVWLSWDLGLMRLNEHGHGWGGGTFAWLGGDYEGVLGLKGYRRWSLGAKNGSYFLAGPGVILLGGIWDRKLRHPGYLLEFEVGFQDVAFSTSVTFLPYKEEYGHWDLVGTEYLLTPGKNGLDMAWSTGVKLAGKSAGLSTAVFALLVVYTFQRTFGLD